MTKKKLFTLERRNNNKIRDEIHRNRVLDCEVTIYSLYVSLIKIKINLNSKFFFRNVLFIFRYTYCVATLLLSIFLLKIICFVFNTHSTWECGVVLHLLPHNMLVQAVCETVVDNISTSEHHSIPRSTY